MTDSTLLVRVNQREMETAEIVRLEFSSVTGADLPPFSAGSHIDVYLPNGLIRQYSLCNSPEERHRYVIGVLKDPKTRGGSAAAHALKEGAEIKISAPRNHFSLVGGAKNVLIAGGIGVTPILAMAEQLSSEKADFEVHLCTRSAEHTPFQRRWQQDVFAGKTRFHHDGADPAKRVNFSDLLSTATDETHVYVCGPGSFIDAVLAAGRSKGLTESQLHREYFAATPIANLSADFGFSVVLEKSGLATDVGPNESIVEALRRRGIEVPVSCEQGVCGTCLTRVIAGVPDHRDMFLTDEEHALNNQMTLCCSRSLTESLTLNL